MGIKVRGATKNYNADKIIERAIGKVDPYENPFELINLRYSPRRKTYHKAKTKGFEDTMITRDAQAKTLTIEYRGGSVEWLRDPIDGGFFGKCARTKQNMEVLAVHYYDELWQIREPHIRAIVKRRADELEELSKDMPNPFPTDHETLYEYNLYRRKGHFVGRGRMDISQRSSKKVIEDDMTLAEAKLAKRLIDIERKEAEIAEREKLIEDASFATPPETPKVETKGDPGSEAIVYTEEELNKMNPMTLKKKARDLFGIDESFNMKKPEVVAAVLKCQSEDLVETQKKPETEIVTS